jgi:hypothetical protein
LGGKPLREKRKNWIVVSLIAGYLALWTVAFALTLNLIFLLIAFLGLPFFRRFIEKMLIELIESFGESIRMALTQRRLQKEHEEKSEYEEGSEKTKMMERADNDL